MATAVNTILNGAALLKGIRRPDEPGKPDIGETVDQVFAEEDDFVKRIVAIKDLLAQPEERAGVTHMLDEMKENLKVELGGLTEANLPKTVEEMQGVFLSALVGGMMVGNLKTALALIAEATPPAPEPPKSA